MYNKRFSERGKAIVHRIREGGAPHLSHFCDAVQPISHKASSLRPIVPRQSSLPSILPPSLASGQSFGPSAVVRVSPSFMSIPRVLLTCASKLPRATDLSTRVQQHAHNTFPHLPRPYPGLMPRKFPPSRSSSLTSFGSTNTAARAVAPSRRARPLYQRHLGSILRIGVDGVANLATGLATNLLNRVFAQGLKADVVRAVRATEQRRTAIDIDKKHAQAKRAARVAVTRSRSSGRRPEPTTRVPMHFHPALSPDSWEVKQFADRVPSDFAEQHRAYVQSQASGSNSSFVTIATSPPSTPHHTNRSAPSVFDDSYIDDDNAHNRFEAGSSVLNPIMLGISDPLPSTSTPGSGPSRIRPRADRPIHHSPRAIKQREPTLGKRPACREDSLTLTKSGAPGLVIHDIQPEDSIELHRQRLSRQDRRARSASLHREEDAQAMMGLDRWSAAILQYRERWQDFLSDSPSGFRLDDIDDVPWPVVGRFSSYFGPAVRISIIVQGMHTDR